MGLFGSSRPTTHHTPKCLIVGGGVRVEVLMQPPRVGDEIRIAPDGDLLVVHKVIYEITPLNEESRDFVLHFIRIEVSKYAHQNK